MAVKYGYRHCFQMLGANLASYCELFDTFDYLGYTVSVHSLDFLAARLFIRRRGKKPVEYRAEWPNREVVFALLWRIMTDDFQTELECQEKVWSVLRHVDRWPERFESVDRLLLRAAWIERVQPSGKEIADFDGHTDVQAGACTLSKSELREEIDTRLEDFDDLNDTDWDWLCG